MPPLTLMIKPASGSCNLRCTYCFYADVAANRETASYGLMTADTLEALVRRVFQYADGEVSFLFQGGEPTLAGKAFYRQFLSLLQTYNTHRIHVRCALQTNGTLLDDEWCDIFQEGDFLIGVSVDGTKDIHDAFRKDAGAGPTYSAVMKGVRLLQRRGIEYNILCVVNERTAEHPAEVYEALKEHSFLQFIPCLDTFDGVPAPYSLRPESFGRFLIETFDLYERDFLSRHPVSIRTFDNWLQMLLGYPPESCAMSGRCGQYYLVEADGSVYPCDFYVLDEWKLGNFNRDRVAQIDERRKALGFCARSLNHPPECKACQWLPLCKGGCYRSRLEAGEPDAGRNYFCEGYQMFFTRRADTIKEIAREIQKRNGAGI